MVRITLKRSYIGVPDKQRKILQALGLKKIGVSVTRQENDAVLGMVNKVSHLVSMEKIGQ